MGIENDEPLTPAGRLFTQPATHQIINCVLGLEQPLGVDAARTVISDSLMIKHPRFCSLLVTDKHGHEYWRKTEIDIDRHIILHSDPVGEAGDDEAAINDYLADLTVSCPLSTDKPLWEIHLLWAHNCLVMRIHHALGDGVSLLSLTLTLFRKLDDPEQTPTIEPLISSTRTPKESGIGEKLSRLFKMIWFTMIYMFEFIMRSLWVKDKRTVVRGGDGVELWPRKLATAKFSLEDMKTVKNAVSNADIKELMKKNTGSGWGNRFGIMLLPVYYHKIGSDPLQYLKRAKSMIDRKKLSLEAFLSYQFGLFVMKTLGAKFASMLNYRIVCNTSFTISNVVGPREEFTVAGIPVTYLRTTSSSLSHAITMHMMSYGDKADMNILVAKDIIPDPEVLAKCFQDSLLEMKEVALQM